MPSAAAAFQRRRQVIARARAQSIITHCRRAGCFLRKSFVFRPSGHTEIRFGHSSAETYLNATPAHRRTVAELQATMLVAAARHPGDFWPWLVEFSPELDSFNPGFVLGEIVDEISGLRKCAGLIPDPSYIEKRIAALQELRVQLIVGILEALILAKVRSPALSLCAQHVR